MFPYRSPRIRHRNELTERDWENAVQGLGNTCIRSSGLPVGSHSIVGRRAQKSGHRLAGVANGTSKNVGLGKFWQDLKISEVFLMISLEVSFLHGLYLLF